MIVLSDERFRIAGYHQRRAPDEASSELKQGLVVTVELQFQRWLHGQRLTADAFVDPGADHSLISLRWLLEQAQAHHPSSLTPRNNPDGLLTERVELSIGEWTVPLGDASRPVWLFEQDYLETTETSSLPGYEDLLLGRDFLCQHDLLFIVDGKKRSFSMLAPTDEDNRKRRERILLELESPSPQDG